MPCAEVPVALGLERRGVSSGAAPLREGRVTLACQIARADDVI
jgi:hypothetical protein